MEAFFNGPYFWPVIVILLVALFTVVIWTVMSSKKQDKKIKEEEQNKPVEEVITTVPETKDIEEMKKELVSKEELQEWVSKTICQKLSLDILNIDYDMAQNKDRINKECLLYKEKDLVDFYVRAYPFNIGAEIGLAVKQLFSKGAEMHIHTLLPKMHWKVFLKMLSG